MYHWYLLIKKYLSNAQTNSWDDHKLIADHEPEIFRSIRRKAFGKLFLLGLIELTPAILGFFASGYLGKILFPYDFIIVGLLVSALVVKHFSKKTPDLPLSLRA